jgi:hypothetical protein
LWSLFGPSTCRCFAEPNRALRPFRDPVPKSLIGTRITYHYEISPVHTVPELSTRVLLPCSYQSAAPLFAYYSQFVLFRSSQLTYYSTARTNPQLTISIPLPCSYQSPAPLSSPLISLVYLAHPGTHPAHRCLPTAHPGAHLLLIQVLTHCSPGTHALLSLLLGTPPLTLRIIC